MATKLWLIRSESLACCDSFSNLKLAAVTTLWSGINPANPPSKNFDGLPTQSLRLNLLHLHDQQIAKLNLACQNVVVIVVVSSLRELSNNRMHRNSQGDRLGSKGYLRPVMLAVEASLHRRTFNRQPKATTDRIWGTYVKRSGKHLFWQACIHRIIR